MATIQVIDTLFSMEAPSTVLKIPSCGDPVAACTAAMDATGINKVVLAPCKRWNCERHWVCGEIQIDEVLHCVSTQPGRFVGLACYNPYAIAESLQQIDAAIRQYDFRGVYVATEGSDVSLRDRRMYPLYAKCTELNTPVVIQFSRLQPSASAALSEIDSLLVDFPDLVVIAAITGSPDIPTLKELCAKHSNLYIACDGSASDGQKAQMIEWLSTSGAQRCMWGSNGLPWENLLHQIHSYSLPEPVHNAFLYENATRIFGISVPVRTGNFPEKEKVVVAE